MRRRVVPALVAGLALAACSTGSGVRSRGQSAVDRTVASTSGTTSSPSSTSGSTTSSAVGSTSTSSSAPETSGPATTGTSSTAVSSTAAPTVPPTVPATTAPGTPVTGAGTAWVAGSQEGDPEVVATEGSCAPFYAAIAGGTYSVARCGVWHALGGNRVWTVTKGSTGRFFAVVWQATGAGSWVPKLRLLEPAPGVWDDVHLATSNIDTGANDELVAGTHVTGTGKYLTVEVVDIRSGAPKVVARVTDLHHGVAHLDPAGVYLYSAGFADPECCPTTFAESLLVSTASGWRRVDVGTVVAPATPPPSDV